MKKEFMLPIVGSKEVAEFNKRYNTTFKDSDEILNEIFEGVVDMIGELCEEEGCYSEDSIKITVNLEYMSQSK